LSIATVVTRGFGSFGTIADVVTQGFSIRTTSTLTAADVWNYKLESGVSAKQMMRMFAAVLGGYVEKFGNNTPTFSSPWDSSKIRVQYSTDDLGNRIKQLVMDLD
jgi:hypothetical protein